MTDKIPKTSENVLLSVKQIKAITALLSERTGRAAAKRTGVSEKTLYLWMGDPVFRAALRSAEAGILDEVTRRLTSGQALALDALEMLITKAKHESTKRQAAVDWLNLSLKFIDTVNIDQRLTALEAAIYDNKK